jgi:hypothetical protein
MTLPDERYRAIRNTREFLRSLLDRKKTPRVPLNIRKSAYACLRHYPGEFDMEKALKNPTDVFHKVKDEYEE